jgi:homoserine O-acetyltransferase/O-succinyltransferase
MKSNQVKTQNQVQYVDDFLEYGKVAIGSLLLESGELLENVELAYERVGPRHAPAILVCHALTGNHVTVGTKESPGWWRGLIGPEEYVDTQKVQVITMNVLGGCNGSTGPATINPITQLRYRMDFPNITIRDMVRAQFSALEQLGINKLKAVIGGSLGGMQVYEWGILYPEFMQTLIILAATPYLSDYGIAFNGIGSQAIKTDLNWENGNYLDNTDLAGLQVARMVGMVTYRSPKMFNDRFKRKCEDNQNPQYQVEDYLKYQGEKLAKRFDANSYLYLLQAMNQHDIGLNRDGWQGAIRHIQANVIGIGFKGDLLYPPDEIHQVVRELNSQGKKAFFHEVNTAYGHDGFLVEYEKWGPIIRKVIG